MFGSVDDTAAIAAAIARGARGFLSWDANNSAASPARQRPANFGRLSPTYDPMRVAAVLTERELQILRGMTRGLSNGEIGRKLFLSEDTVKTHARTLFQTTRRARPGARRRPRPAERTRRLTQKHQLLGLPFSGLDSGPQLGNLVERFAQMTDRSGLAPATDERHGHAGHRATAGT